MKLVGKHLSYNNKLHKLFNKHTVRINYCCSESMKSFINRNNQTILKKHDKRSTNDSRLCNCRNHNQCPMQGNCLQANVVDKADITTTDNNETKTYIGVTANEFNTRFRNHTKSINNRKYQNKTELSKYICMATERQQPTTQDQVGNHQENSVQQTRPEEMGPMPLTETIDFNRTKQKHFK